MTEERRLVTVLFADVVGSTALGEELDPEDTRALLGRLFAIATEAVEERGGRVEKFIGDAVMAVFGFPAAHDDDPERALLAALDLRDRVRADPALSARIAIRLGVNGGEVVATRDRDAREFLVTGDAVNVAARLQSAAEPWSILVGERTVRAAGDDFEFGPPAMVEAKGKSTPVAARVLIGAARSRTPAARRRIVGRDADLAQLDLAARRAFEERRPYLVNIIAPAGVGKSRLLEEFLDHRPAGATVAIAQCLPYGQRLTYSPMRAILLSIVGLAEHTPAEAIRGAVEAWLREAGDSEPRRSAEQLAATIGAAEVETGDRVALLSAWRQFVELAAERAPLVLVLEDLHWSSDSLLDLIEAILQPRADVPLLMIALARPELLDRRPTWGGGRRNAVSISLEPLARAAVAELVADLLESPAPAVVAAVVERAEGNPFYAGEIVRSLAERLGSAMDDTEVAATIAALPDTVQATVLARLDALDAAARRVVQLGAVIGRSFQVEAIPALDGSLGQSAVETAVELLVDRDLVRPSGPKLVTFRHILIREVAYGMLTRADRARLHAAAGTWLEREAIGAHREDELAELVAFHLREAVSLGSILGETPDAETLVRTVRWLRQAADAAAAGAATTEAARHLNAAIELAADEAKPALYERLGQIWISGDQGLEAFEQAVDLGRRHGLGPEQELRTLAQAVTIATRFGGSISSRSPRERDAARLDRLRELVAGPVSDEARLLGWIALSFGGGVASPFDKADLAAADAAGVEAVELAKRLGSADLLSAALDARAAAAIRDDRIDHVVPLLEERRRLAPKLAMSERIDTWLMTAWMSALGGDLGAAEAAAVEARAGLGEGQGPAWRLGASAWRILALYALGRWDEAMVEAGRAEASWHESDLRAPWFALNGFLAATAIARGRADPIGLDRWRGACRTIFERSDPVIRTQRMAGFVDDDPDALAETAIGDGDGLSVFAGRLDYLFLALSFLADRRHAVDRAALDTIIGYTEERSIRLVSSQGRRLRGLLAADPADLEIALATFEEMAARPFLARAWIELGGLRRDASLVDRGITELEALGDVEHLARVGPAAGGSG